jgi:hypothetical protein
MKSTCSFTLRVCLAAAALALFGRASAEDKAWGTVKGRIVYDAPEAPEPKDIDTANNADKKQCLAKGPLHSEELVVNKKNLGVRWVFVWLAAPQTGSKLPIHKDLQKIKVKELELDQPCCAFVPHALALRQGQTLIAKNSSPTTHNINWSGLNNPGGNVVLPAQKTVVIDDLVADRLPVSLACNIHPWMKGYVWVFNHPYYAVTDADGKFEIKLAPAGQVQLVLWQDLGWGPGGKKGNEIVIKGGEVLDLGDIKIKPE